MVVSGYSYSGFALGGENGGFAQFGDVGLRIDRFDGVWHSCGLRDPASGFCVDAPAAADGPGKGTAGSGASVLKAGNGE